MFVVECRCECGYCGWYCCGGDCCVGDGVDFCECYFEFCGDGWFFCVGGDFFCVVFFFVCGCWCVDLVWGVWSVYYLLLIVLFCLG